MIVNRFKIDFRMEHDHQIMGNVVNILVTDMQDDLYRSTNWTMFTYQLFEIKDIVDKFIAYRGRFINELCDRFRISSLKEDEIENLKNYYNDTVEYFCSGMFSRRTVIQSTYTNSFIPEEVKEALAISSLAIKRGEQIKEYVKEIEDRKKEYARKYGKWYERLWFSI